MSTMPGQRELLNICYSCLRYKRVIGGGLPLIRPTSTSTIFLRGFTQCHNCYSASSGTTTSQESAKVEKKRKDFSIEENPFFEKYKNKLQHLAVTQPDDFSERMNQLVEERKPQRQQSAAPHSTGIAEQPAAPCPTGYAERTAVSLPIPQTAVYSSQKGLDSVMKLELIQDKSPEEIEKIWKDYHRHKDCVFAVIKKEEFEDLQGKARNCPTFVYPLPRNEGFEFMLMQFDGKDIQFTPLGMYQIVRENSLACLTLVHYTELMESKGLVLMSGHYDDKVLKREDALLLVQMMGIYYGKNSPRFSVVESFNHHPGAFDYKQLIQDYRNMYIDSSVTNN